MAVMAKRELVQHGARSVTFIMDAITTGQSAGRPLRYKLVVVPDRSRRKARPNLLANRRSTLTLWCLRQSFQDKRLNFLIQMQIKNFLSGSKRSKTALRTHKVFSCDAIHNTGDGTLEQCETDTDPSGHLCIMTDILVRARTTSWTHNIRVKVDPGTDANLMPVHHFRTIFPYLCDSTGQPKEGVLERAEGSFESYSRHNVTVTGQTKIYAKNIQTGKFLVTRIYVIARDRGPILLSNAVSQWLGLIAMLCENKTAPVGRFVASVTREETEGGEVVANPILKTSDSSERTEKSNSQATSQRAHHSTKEEELDQEGKTNGICTSGHHPTDHSQ